MMHEGGIYKQYKTYKVNMAREIYSDLFFSIIMNTSSGQYRTFFLSIRRALLIKG